jgi:hypothetical protein
MRAKVMSLEVKWRPKGTNGFDWQTQRFRPKDLAGARAFAIEQSPKSDRREAYIYAWTDCGRYLKELYRGGRRRPLTSRRRQKQPAKDHESRSVHHPVPDRKGSTP